MQATASTGSQLASVQSSMPAVKHGVMYYFMLGVGVILKEKALAGLRKIYALVTTKVIAVFAFICGMIKSYVCGIRVEGSFFAIGFLGCILLVDSIIVTYLCCALNMGVIYVGCVCLVDILFNVIAATLHEKIHPPPRQYTVRSFPNIVFYSLYLLFSALFFQSGKLYDWVLSKAAEFVVRGKTYEIEGK